MWDISFRDHFFFEGIIGDVGISVRIRIFLKMITESYQKPGMLLFMSGG